MEVAKNSRDDAEIARQVVALCARRWRPHVMFALESQPRRFNELGRAIEGVSAKVLAQTLRGLERDELTRRSNTRPGRARYELTPLGDSLVDQLRGLAAWGRRHLGGARR